MTALRTTSVLLFSLAALQAQAQQPAASAPAGMQTLSAALTPTTAPGAKGIAGLVRFSQSGSGVMVEGTVTGLKPNSEHGFHIHENGDCSGDGKAAGGHFNPTNAAHGNPKSDKHHAGDLPNLKANAQGLASIKYQTSALSLMSGANAVMGKAVVLHATADDYKTQPAGDSGDRVACGVIRR